MPLMILFPHTIYQIHALTMMQDNIEVLLTNQLRGFSPWANHTDRAMSYK
jgi:hypothetical protein